MATDLHAVLQQWLNNGYMSVNALTFDVGNQTMSALSVTPNVVIEKLSDDQFSGNGSLMRTLPVAFMYDDPELIVEQAMEFSRATHPSANAQICCALYCLIAHFLLKGNSINEAVDFSLISLYHLKSKYVSTINLVRDYDKYEHTGTGFVIDSLWSAIEAVHRSTSYESAIKLSIAFGNDTDTTACIAGGLAGIIYGVEGIPVRWYDQLQCREVISDLIEKVATK
jgi:ADP-ribosyl-[dinitrogen reductase] hydrolase